MREEPTPQQRARYCVLAEPERLEELIAEQIFEAVRCVLERLGTPQLCITCGKPIYWVMTVNGSRRTPYSVRGVPHTSDCDMQERPGRLRRWQQQNAK